MANPNVNLIILQGRLANQPRVGVNATTGQSQADFKMLVTDSYSKENREFEVICRAIGQHAIERIKQLSVGDTVTLDGKLRFNKEAGVGFVESFKVA